MADPKAILSGIAASYPHLKTGCQEVADRIGELEAGLTQTNQTAKLLYNNAVHCVANHHVADIEKQGLPRWLQDAKQAIEDAEERLGNSGQKP